MYNRMTSSGSRSTYPYIEGVDGLRGIAVIGVIFYHLNATFLPGGFSGVDVFFVISGYVVSRSLADHQNGNGGLFKYLLSFYSRRIVRLMPALIACLILTSLASVLFVPSSWLSDTIFRTGLFAYFGVSNFALAAAGDSYYAARAEFNPFTHTWSLAVEEQFYLVFPVVIYVWMQFYEKKSWLGSGLRSALLVLIGASMLYAWRETAVDHNRAFYLIFSRFWELAFGGLLFQFHYKGVLVPKSGAASAACMISGLAAIFISFAYSTPLAYPFPMALIPVVGALLVIAGTVNQDGAVSSWGFLIRNRITVYVGKISYSLYLWHWPVFVLLRWTFGLEGTVNVVSALVAAVGLSVASYHLIETPVRRGGSRWIGRRGVVLVSGAVLAVAGWGLSSALFQHQADVSLSVTSDKEAWYPYAWPRHNDDLGFFAGKTMFVAGDSHAAAYSTMFQQLTDNDKLTVHGVQKGGCAVAHLYHSISPTCSDFVEGALAEIESKGKPGDIVFLPALRVGRLMTDQVVYDDATILGGMHTEHAKVEFKKAFVEAKDIIERLQAKSLRVLIEAPKPVFKAMPYRCSDWFNASNPICAAGLDIPRDFLLNYRKPMMDSIDELKKIFPDLIVWDPFPVLCPDEKCSAVVDGKPLFFDSDHLSANGNRVLYPSFRSVLASVYLADVPQYRALDMNVSQMEGVMTVGLSGAEPWGRWTDGKRVAFSFARKLPASGFRAVLVMNGAFTPIQGKEIVVTVGEQTRRFIAPADKATIALDFPEGASGADTIELMLPDVTSPKELGVSGDPRALGLAVVRFEIARLPSDGGA